ncbi:MAG: AAA family ATPase [Deltaproteobacteria bacterium]|nr:AAA family ATPase [Deltaproteobacteria bacterium]MBI3389333.1 AAA family ATPase [Deltaproteobacteria bacterium]
MRCAACNHENRDTAKFCLGCGQPLALRCTSCQAELPPGARFCDECGAPAASDDKPKAQSQPLTPNPSSYTPKHLATKILTSRGALEGERKQVTVLFLDVVGSTPLAERIGPEEMHGIMDRCFRLLAEEVHRYEGTINQFTGDGIMALFGAPIAHEDAPERAVRAALGMQAALRRYGDELERERGIDFRMRIGINTGPVVVGKIGDDLRMDYTAIGDTTNLAARLQTAAAPGTILISDHTAKSVAGRFLTRPMGALQLKGKSLPVQAHEVVRTLPRAPLVAPSEHGLTPLVGRSAEITALETVFAHVRAGRGQIAFVVGEAGIGKSRLIYEFRRRISDQEYTWLQGRCISFGRGIPFLPIVDALKNSFAIEEADDDATIIEKVRAGIATLGATVASAEPYLRALLAVDPGDPAIAQMDAGARRFATFEALKQLMLATAARQPLVLLIEDLHWLDPASEEFLTYILDAMAGARVLLLCTYRPGYRPALGERSFITRVALQPLTPDQTATMAAVMLEAREFPSELRSLIIAKAEGNPFFIEEVTKSLVEIGALRRSADGYVLGRPVSEILIPDRIQDVIMARIDRLGDDAKRAIQIASVIGREFAIRLLQRASELGENLNPLVGELRALELIYEKAGVPELAYMFKHALTHDVAYESLLMQRRKRLHRTIGLAVEELYADRLAEYWETLAHHFYRAEDWPRAFAYLVKAGDKARAAFANREAVHFYSQALDAAGHQAIDTRQRAAVHEGKGLAHFCLSEFTEAIDNLRHALELVEDPVDRAEINAELAEALLWAHELDAALVAADTAIALAEPAGAIVVAANATFVRGFVHMLRAQLTESAACFSTVERMSQQAGQRALGGRVRLNVALQANWRGDYREAVADCERALVEFKDANELLHLLEGYSQFGIMLGGAGDYARMLPNLANGIALAESIGDKVWRARMWNTRGWVLTEIGHYDAAEEANRRCIEIAQQLGALRIASELIGNAEANLADVALARGDLIGSEPHLAAVGAILSDRRNEWMTWRYGMHFHASAAELALARSDLDRARQHIEACLATAQRTKSHRYIVRATRLLAACHISAGNVVEAERVLGEVVRAARALANPPQLWHALLAQGRALHSLGRHDDAAAVWREALTLVAAVEQTLPAELQTTLRGSALVTTLGELTL